MLAVLVMHVVVRDVGGGAGDGGGGRNVRQLRHLQNEAGQAVLALRNAIRHRCCDSCLLRRNPYRIVEYRVSNREPVRNVHIHTPIYYLTFTACTRIQS